MKKKLSLLVTLLVCSFAFAPGIKAACPAERQIELSKEASEMKFTYEVYEKKGEDDPTSDSPAVTEYYMNVYIYNVPDDVRIDVTSPNNAFKAFSLDYTKRDENNIILIQDPLATTLKDYEFSVVSTSSDCNKEVLRTASLTTPMFNPYYDALVCNSYPEFYMCATFVDFDISTTTMNQFNESVNNYIDKLNSEEEEKGTVDSVLKAVSKYKYVIIIVSVILIGGLVTFIVIKKRGSRVL